MIARLLNRFDSQEVLRAILDYDPESGLLTWLERPRWFYAEDEQWKRDWWNRRYAGRPAFVGTNADGYRQGTIRGVKYKAHRVIWKWMTGTEASGQIDHINGKPSDNSWANLRVVTNAENGRNRALPRNNTSGRIGVSWNTRYQRWYAAIKVGGQHICLGSFATFAEAVAAREAGEQEHGFHLNHGNRLSERAHV
jgi:hypothetical protein